MVTKKKPFERTVQVLLKLYLEYFYKLYYTQISPNFFSSELTYYNTEQDEYRVRILPFFSPFFRRPNPFRLSARTQCTRVSETFSS